MKFTEDIRPVTYLKKRASELIRHVDESRRPVVITQNGEAKAVVLDVKTYESMRDAMLLLKLTAQGEADIRAGRTLPQSEALSRLQTRLERP
jgi:prevent-host-death family protein